MQLKPPPVERGQAGLAEFRKSAKTYELSLTSRTFRNFYRSDMAKWQKLYATLAAKQPAGSDAATHFISLSSLCRDLLDQFGPESPPKQMASKAFTPVPLLYPEFPEEITHRLHFLEGPGARRQRALTLSEHAPFVSRQTSGTGRVLISLGTRSAEVRLYERIVEAIGDGLFGNPRAAGFVAGHNLDPNAALPSAALSRIWSDNNHARGYSWQARALGDQYLGGDGKGVPKGAPDRMARPAWDPDPRWQRILDLTEANRLAEAADLVEVIPGVERETLLDEVIYLKFLIDRELRADDVRLVARRYAAASLISGRLLDEFEGFIAYLDQQLRDEPPVLSAIGRFSPDFGQGMIPVPPPASNWPAFRTYEAQFINPSAPRGRIFAINIDVGFNNVERILKGHMALAEDAFRRDRGIPEIGVSGWTSERALLDLCKGYWPNTEYQWRPWFLGRQSIDIYLPDLNLAVEYQGHQHYEPVDLFGGKEGYLNTQLRDARKRALLEANKIRLLEWRYDLPITVENLRSSLVDMGVALPVSE